MGVREGDHMIARPRLEFKVISVVENRHTGETIRRNEIRRSFLDHDLEADLDNFWRITRELANLNDAIAKLCLVSHDGARSIWLRDPPLASDAKDRETATTIKEALFKLNGK